MLVAWRSRAGVHPQPIYAAVAIASYLGIIVIHEAGHAWVAHRLGMGRRIHVSFLHGDRTHDMPYNETDHVLIAWASRAQLAVAIPILTVATIFDRQDFGYAAPAIAFLGYVNVVIALATSAGVRRSHRLAGRCVAMEETHRHRLAPAAAIDDHTCAVSHLPRLNSHSVNRPTDVSDTNTPRKRRCAASPDPSQATTTAGSGSARRTRR